MNKAFDLIIFTKHKVWSNSSTQNQNRLKLTKTKVKKQKNIYNFACLSLSICVKKRRCLIKDVLLWFCFQCKTAKQFKVAVHKLLSSKDQSAEKNIEKATILQRIMKHVCIRCSEDKKFWPKEGLMEIIKTGLIPAR